MYGMLVAASLTSINVCYIMLSYLLIFLLTLQCFQSFRTTVLATSAFLESFQKVADMATSTKGQFYLLCWGKCT